MANVIVNDKVVVSYNNWVRTINMGEYSAYINVRKVNKYGRRHWVFCSKQKRHVHLLSDGERRTYEILISLPGTIYVMEQYALDFTETLEIANQFGFIHPRNYKTKELAVMTTDFVVNHSVVDVFGNKKLKFTAYTFKYSSELYSDERCEVFSSRATRTLQKLKIEKEYWRRRGVEYVLITEKHATKEFFWNIQFCKNGLKEDVNKKTAEKFSCEFLKYWSKNSFLHLEDLLSQFATILKIDEEMCLQLFKFCVINRFLKLSNTSCIQLYRPIELN